ncbi:vegetative cell wall protein gp1-like [Vombatus ursinus]|uniref:vegetative cell wall protein gp1-like n=1 Tax=Vombatus ursinus TaxID=29139 RepID=UPI000FFDAA00|nr:vegetative cell wall protein gp1-like [Vombatus ursinus]
MGSPTPQQFPPHALEILESLPQASRPWRPKESTPPNATRVPQGLPSLTPFGAQGSRSAPSGNPQASPIRRLPSPRATVSGIRAFAPLTTEAQQGSLWPFPHPQEPESTFSAPVPRGSRHPKPQLELFSPPNLTPSAASGKKLATGGSRWGPRPRTCDCPSLAAPALFPPPPMPPRCLPPSPRHQGQSTEGPYKPVTTKSLLEDPGRLRKGGVQGPRSSDPQSPPPSLASEPSATPSLQGPGHGDP